jgi:hypothetical protein
MNGNIYENNRKQNKNIGGTIFCIGKILTHLILAWRNKK